MGAEVSSSISHHVLGLVLASNSSTFLAVAFVFRVLGLILMGGSGGSPPCLRRWFLQN